MMILTQMQMMAASSLLAAASLTSAAVSSRLAVPNLVSAVARFLSEIEGCTARSGKREVKFPVRLAALGLVLGLGSLTVVD